MKRTLVIALVFFVVAALVLAGAWYLLFGRGMPDNARAQLNQYVAYRYPLPPTPVVLNEKQAARPWFFNAEDSAASYGDSVYYQTTVRYGRVATPLRFPATPEATPGYASYYAGQHPLPYPPDDLWCVRLDLGEQGSSIITVAMHQDLYGGDWVVHELPGTWSGADRAAALAQWDCAW